MVKWNFQDLFQDALICFVLLAVFEYGARGQSNITDSELGNSTMTSTDEPNSQDNRFLPDTRPDWAASGHNASSPDDPPGFTYTSSNMTSPNMTSSAANVTGSETSPGTEGEFWETDTTQASPVDGVVHGMSVDTSDQNGPTDNTTLDFEDAINEDEPGNVTTPFGSSSPTDGFATEESFTDENTTWDPAATDAGSPFDGLPIESSHPTHGQVHGEDVSGPNTPSPSSSDLGFAPGNGGNVSAGVDNEDALNATVDDPAWPSSVDDMLMNTTSANDTHTDTTLVDGEEDEDDDYGDGDYYGDDDDDYFYDAGEDENNELGDEFWRGNDTDWDPYGETNSTLNDTSFNETSFNGTTFNETSLDDTAPSDNITEATDSVNVTDADTDLNNITTPSDDYYDEDDYYDDDDDYYGDYEEEETVHEYTDDDVLAANDTLPDDVHHEGYDIATKPTDEATPQAPEKADFVVYESDGSPCLLASLNITIHFKYAVQEGLVRETYETVSKKNTQDGSSHRGTCEDLQSTLSITWSNATFTLNLTFSIQDKEVADSKRIDMDVRPPGTNTSGQYWALEQVSLSYDTGNDLMFPEAYNPAVRTVRAGELSLFQTPLGMSYVCRTPEVVTVQFKDVDLAFNFIHLMPFGVTSQYFSNVTVECSGDMHSVPAAEEYTVPLIVASVLAGIVCAIIVVYGTMRCVTRRLRQADYKQME